MSTDSTHSRLDPDWPPYAPPSGWLAEKLAFMIQWRNDTLFGFLRFFKPILALPKGGPVLVSRYDDVLEILHNPKSFGVMYKPMIDKSVGKYMLAHDNSVYNQRDKGVMRSLIQEKDLKHVQKVVAKISRKCIERGDKGRPFEVVSLLSRRAPILLTDKYFGFAGPDIKTMMRWSRATQYDFFHNQEMSGSVHDNNLIAGQEMREYLKKVLLPARRKQLKKNPDLDDIVSRMLKVEMPKSIGWDHDRVIVNVIGLLVGGVETTSQAVVQILDQFFKHPKALEGAEQAARHNDDSRLYEYCWEALRFNPINPVLFRKCNEDYRIAAGTFRTKKIKAGRVVIVGSRSAMKDSREIKRPKKFRTGRPDSHYLHLGVGMHRCLGDYVSKVQVPEIIKALLLKKNLRRAPGSAGQINFKDGPFPESFSVVFDD